jgi:mannosyl-oligosaccharide alpha-1,2-mannosidase
LSNLANNATAVDAVLKQAERLASNLAFAFDTPTGIPSNNLYFNPPHTDGGTTNGLATIGSLVLEWTHLSDLTGNKTYGELTQKGESYLLNPQPASSEPWPGLLGTNVDINTGLFQDASGGWVGGDDSFYEYLIKMYVYDSTRFAEYRDRWILAADSSILHLASHPSTRPDLTFLAEFDGQERIFQSEHR